MITTEEKKEKLILVGIAEDDVDAAVVSLEELAQLADTAGWRRQRAQGAPPDVGAHRGLRCPVTESTSLFLLAEKKTGRSRAPPCFLAITSQR